jgi:hypothetical protein
MYVCVELIFKLIRICNSLAKIEEELQQACQEHEHEKVLITRVTFLIFLCHVVIPYLKKPTF